MKTSSWAGSRVRFVWYGGAGAAGVPGKDYGVLFG